MHFGCAKRGHISLGVKMENLNKGATWNHSS